MPQRFLRPGITNSERWNACTFPAQSLYVRLLTLVDDFGRCDGRPQVLWGACFAMRPDVKLQQVAVMLQQLSQNKLIDIYEIEGKKVLQILQWQERIREGCRPKWPERTELAASCSKLLPSSPPPSPSITRHTVAERATCEEIYAAYPRKVAKPEALRAIGKAISRGTSSAVLLARTKRYAETTDLELRFIPHPATWFNQERFNDDPATWKNGASVKPKEKAPSYQKIAPPRELTPEEEAEAERARKIAREESARFKEKFK